MDFNEDSEEDAIEEQGIFTPAIDEHFRNGAGKARQVFRDLIDMPADVTTTEREVEVRFHRRAHLPIIAASGLLDEPVTVPWWNGMSLRMRV